MTKREEIKAWDRTIRQWAWYEKHPLAKKEEYFEKHPKIEEPHWYLCFLCDLYSKPPSLMGCPGCPLFEQHLGCRGDNNEYGIWYDTVYNLDCRDYLNKKIYTQQARIIKEAVMKWKEDHR